MLTKSISTLKILEKLGVKYEFVSKRDLILDATNAFLNQKENLVFDCGNSGTTIRLLTGLLAGKGIEATLTGDESLSKRPMSRVAAPLSQLGAVVSTTDGHAPVHVYPAELSGADVRLQIASAQEKSAVLLAGKTACALRFSAGGPPPDPWTSELIYIRKV